jgi:hypothetical protein
MAYGLLVIPAGMLWERRRRRRRLKPEEIGRYPVLDPNGPRRRRSFVVLLLLDGLRGLPVWDAATYLTRTLRPCGSARSTPPTT